MVLLVLRALAICTLRTVPKQPDLRHMTRRDILIAHRLSAGAGWLARVAAFLRIAGKCDGDLGWPEMPAAYSIAPGLVVMQSAARHLGEQTHGRCPSRLEKSPLDLMNSTLSRHYARRVCDAL